MKENGNQANTKGENMQKSMKHEDGKLKIQVSDGVDMDKDGVQSVSTAFSIEINAVEAVNEIVKDGAPQWLKDLVASKG